MDTDLVIFLSILLILYIISMVNRFTAFDSPSKVTYVYPDQMNTGDLLCVSYNNFATEFVGTFTNSVWVHLGMVWVDPDTNVRYVLEGAMYSNKRYKNFFKIPVETWLTINKSSLMAWKKYSGPEIDAKHMIDVFSQFINSSKLEGLNVSWYRFLLDRDFKEQGVLNKYTCFETIILLGQEIGIFRKEKMYTSHFPSDVVNDKIKLCENVSYSKTIQIQLSEYYRNFLFLDTLQFPEFWKK